MRERLVLALVGLTVVMIALYGIPRAYILADLVQTQEERKVQRSAELVTKVLEQREANDEVINPDFLASLLSVQEGLEYVADDGTVIQAGFVPDPEHDIVRTIDIPSGGELTFSRSADLIQTRVTDALLPLVLTGLLLVVLAGVVGWLLARRLSRPFAELADAAEHLGQGHFDMSVRHQTIPEAEKIAKALRLSAAQLDELLTREREFAANASHQLRTPITALRLTLEDLALWPETHPDVARELTDAVPELDRLSSAIDELLGMSRGQRVGERADVDLSALVAETAQRWRPHVEAAGKQIVIDLPAQPVVARTVSGPVAQVLDVLIENACAHGTGTITVRASDHGKYLLVGVADEGTAHVDHEVFNRGTRSGASNGHGLGLTIASQFATALGGYLTVSSDPTTRFLLALPGPDATTLERVH